MVGKEDDPFLPYWGPRAMFLSFGGRVFAHGNVWLGFWGASGRLTAQFFAEKQVEMLNLVAQATLNSIIKRSQVGSTEKWWVGFHHKNPGVTMGKSTTLKIDRYIYILSLGDVGFLLFFKGSFQAIMANPDCSPPEKKGALNNPEKWTCVCVWNLFLGYPSFPVLVMFSTIWPTYLLHF